MNKKLVRKLALSAVTLGVAALSVTTTTFAWFTTNGTASAEHITANTVAAKANMMIRSWNPNADTPAFGDWTTTATLISKTGSQLQPVEPTSTMGEFKTMNNVSGTTVAIDGADNYKYVVQYKIQFSITDIPAGTSTLKMYLSNMAFTANANQYLLVDATTDTTTNAAAAAGQTISVGLSDVLSLQINTIASNEAGADTALTGDDVATLTATNTNYRNTAETSVETATDALVYYNKVYNRNLTRPSLTYGADILSTVTSADTNNGITIATFTNTTGAGQEQRNKYQYVTTTFTFFIDGWDHECFNAIGSSKITEGKFNFALV